MNSRHGDQVIEAFLHETRDELPERTYAAVRRDIERTPQRLVLGRWSTPFAKNLSRFALIGAAVLTAAVVVLLAFTIAGQRQSNLAGAPTPTPTLSATVLNVTDRGSQIPVGTYSITIPSRATYIFTVTDGWWLDDIGSGRVELHRTTSRPEQAASSIFLSGVKAVYASPCQTGGGATAVDETVPAIVTALTHQIGFAASSPVPVQLDGASGSTFTIDNAIDSLTPDCSGADQLPEWRDLSDFDFGTTGGTHQRLWVLDIGRGNPIVAAVTTFPWTTDGERQEAEDVVSSMTFR